MAQWIETPGNCSADFGVNAADLIANVFPNIMVQIDVSNQPGVMTHDTRSNGDSSRSKQCIELKLQSHHYSPVINGELGSTPEGGDCLYYSFLYVQNGVPPTAEVIQQLRIRLAEYIRNNPNYAEVIVIDTSLTKRSI